ncbi:hypothetical protein EX30DRAFT_398649 [Ascodesmis nigricans]|uniref:Proteasome activator subunit 4 n=1 Tax=Ascodesmis nigricans TaxID=341454 RepID=A0A4S2MK84_9PEZI|nr:hypothetical protein EX30DRAFT_398649 [Ascodesmis nigricans]
MSKIPDYVIAQLGLSGNDQVDSGATSPGAGWGDTTTGGGDQQCRYRPRTFPYQKYLPYEVEDETARQAHLDLIIKQLYISIESRDFVPGAVRWSRELRNWLELKFDLPRTTRVKLVKLYYELAMAPGLDPAVSERFASMFMTLIKRKHYLRPGKDLTLNWKVLYTELKLFVLPQDDNILHTAYNARKNIRTVIRMCTSAQYYFDPQELPAMFEEFLPSFTASRLDFAFVVMGLLNILLPTSPPPPDNDKLQPRYYMPTLFHLWSLVNRSKKVDIAMVDLISRFARDLLPASHIPFGEYGIFTSEQSSLVFTAILRLLDIPVGQSTTPYSNTIDQAAGSGVYLERDQRKSPIAHKIARWVVMSLSPQCLNKENSVLAGLEGLIQAVETFFHPSNSGAWTKTLAQLVFYLADFFVMRWNRESSGEMDIPPERKLNPELKDRFVLCLRDVVFMGIYSKSNSAMEFSLSSLQALAYLQPKLILPGALQRIYPAMQGLVEVHRTTSSLRSLQVLSRILVTTHGFRCHVTTLLGLALPGIDANDLDKTLHTLSLIQTIAYNVPFHDLGADDNGNAALNWVANEADRLEREGADVHIDYEAELTVEDEKQILVSSTAGFAEWVISFLGRIFTLLENLPDASHVRSNSPEEHVMNSLPATFTPLFAALSPELFDIALHKVADFVGSQVIHQARDAMAFICNCLCKVNPEKGLKRLIPVLIRNIRFEIEDNSAASTRNSGSEILPRDRGLVWHISILSMCVVHVGDAVLQHRDELFEIAEYLQRKCKGIPAVHVSNFIHHLLLNCTLTYTCDHGLFEKPDPAGADTWGKIYPPGELTINWHKPSREEIEFSVKLFESQAGGAVKALRSLTTDSSDIKRDGIGKEWSDEVTRNLVLLRLAISGVSVLFDPEYVPEGRLWQKPNDPDSDDGEGDTGLGESDLEESAATRKYESGYPFATREDPVYRRVHSLRDEIGRSFHEVHQFLTSKQEDDVACFNALYTAYRAWFVDVGLERSSHILERVNRLFNSDVSSFKVSGLRKQYPRPLLLRRALLYHIRRLRYNASPRPLSELDRLLLLDLAQSCVSLYPDIRRHAQSAGESATKVMVGSRPLVIPPLLEAYEKALKDDDLRRIKGAMYTLLYGNLSSTAGRNWNFAPTLIRCFIASSTLDKPSIQRLASGAVYHVIDFGRPIEPIIILDESTVRAIAPNEDLLGLIAQKRDRMERKRDKIESKKAALAVELVELARTSHWKTATRAATVAVNMALRFDTIAPEGLYDLATVGTVDQHPGLRGLYSGALVALFCLIEFRVMCDHKYANMLTETIKVPHKLEIQPDVDDPQWTEKFLASFAQPATDYFVDLESAGWLAWGRKFPAYKANPTTGYEYDEVEKKARERIGSHMDRKWFNSFFGFMKQEPREGASDRFRMTTIMLLRYAFSLVRDGIAPTTIEEIQAEFKDVLGDGSDKHQNRAAAEILGAFVIAYRGSTVPADRERMWEFAFPVIKDIFQDGITPDNSSHWASFLHLLFTGSDPRRAWPILEWLASFRLDMNSNAAFKESSKIQLLQQVVCDAGWHFQLEDPIIADFIQHIDHPYKGVREAVGAALGALHRTKHHVSYRDVATLMDIQSRASPIGERPYRATEKFVQTMTEIFDRIEQWRQARTPGQQAQSSYTMACKTVLLWIDGALSSYECTQLAPFFANMFMPQMLHMMDVKEDPELMSLAYHVFRQLPNVPLPIGEDSDFIEALIKIGTTSSFWHQRLRVLINIQVVYFRRLFLISRKHQQQLFSAVSDMLVDTQMEVRMGAAATLSGMIRCSPVRLRDSVLQELKQKFTDLLYSNPLPKRSPAGTPTPGYNRTTLSRHAAVLGLGALVQAFPYASPPPLWLPEVLATLATKAAGDPGMVGTSVKGVLAEFKKTRQDTWHVDVKAFSMEQLEDLEGVLWKSYFA